MPASISGWRGAGIATLPLIPGQYSSNALPGTLIAAVWS